ncbi:MAG: BrnA antitoxin family protein [Anaerolineae bacterium]|nr:BrnA antitoxin family protein [Anaerolineae bacterium]
MNEVVENMLDEHEFAEVNQEEAEGTGSNKTRITIRLDTDILAWFKQVANQQGRMSYQRLINETLRMHVQQQGSWQEALRALIREELAQSRPTEAQPADLALLEARQPRPYALARGEFEVPSDFDDPLPEDILREFEGL